MRIITQKGVNMDKQKIVDALGAGKIKLVSRYNRALLRAGKRLALIGVNLEYANLTEVNLEGANLEAANLTRATLIAANLRRTNLRGTSLRRGNLTAINLDAADLRKANLEAANLEEANLERANLKQTNLKLANLKWANLTEVNLAGASLIGANLDYSSGLPRWCGSFDVKVNDEFAYDEAYHFCRLVFPKGSDGEKIQQYLKRYANRSGLIERHRLQEIGEGNRLEDCLAIASGFCGETITADAGPAQ